MPSLDLLLIADATPSVGAGHAMRLATLGEAWRNDGGRVRAVGTLAIPFVAVRYRALGIAVTDGEWPLLADVVVADSYDQEVRHAAARLGQSALRVLVDDLGTMVPKGFDAVWNPNPYGGPSLYPGFDGDLFSGVGHVPVRDDLPARQPSNQEVVISLGGGAAPPHVLDALDRLARLMPEQRFAITGDHVPLGWRSIDPGDFWQEAGQAEALVSAAGSTVWEASRVGIPVVVLQTAENQRLVFQWTSDAGIPGLNALASDPDLLAHQLRDLLPGARPLAWLDNGAPRVARGLADLARRRRAG